MFALEDWGPSPYDPATLTPLPPRPDFSSLVADALDPTTSASAAIDSLLGQSRDASSQDVDGAHASTVGGVEGDLPGDLSGPSGVDPLLDGGQNTGALRESLLRYLPQADAPLGASFNDPPHPPGGNLVEPGPPGSGPGKPALPGEPGPDPDAIRAVITGYYEDLLGREPDPGGLEHWMQEVFTNQHSIDWVKQQFLNSDEYKQKHPNG